MRHIESVKHRTDPALTKELQEGSWLSYPELWTNPESWVRGFPHYEIVTTPETVPTAPSHPAVSAPVRSAQDIHQLLHAAAETGHIKVLIDGSLSKFNPDWHRPNKHGFTPLQSAVLQGHVETAVLLVKIAGANTKDLYDRKLLHYQSKQGIVIRTIKIICAALRRPIPKVLMTTVDKTVAIVKARTASKRPGLSR